MDRDLAIAICMDHIDRWGCRIRDLLNGSTSPNSIMEQSRLEKSRFGNPRVDKSVVSPDAPPEAPPDAPEAPLDVSTASREGLVRLCHQLGYTKAETKGKRVKTLQQMANRGTRKPTAMLDLDGTGAKPEEA